MTLNISKLQQSIAGTALIEPRKIFTTLPRNPRFKRPSDEQAEVLDGWFNNRSRANNTIKMNTGAGKTVVGLLVLQSSMNEGVGPAVYVAPDNYLARQVTSEAHDLGIKVTDDEHDPSFVSGKSILIINIWKLINGRSAFGVGSEGVKVPIGSVVIDDAHACLATVEDQFSLCLKADHPLYNQLLTLFREELGRQSMAGLLDIEARDPQSIVAVPFWSWKDNSAKVIQLIHEQRKDDDVKFSWPLLRDILPLCQCIFGGNGLEIAPRFLPIDVIPAFTRAARRIYMTATLADDGILVSHFQANGAEIANPIKPRGAGDIGDRMILAPQEINPEITTDEVKALAAEIAVDRNVVVIVPSGKRAEYWRDAAAQILDRENISHGVERIKSGHIGLTVLINKYDGVDLPGQACEMLIIDGLPEVFGLVDRNEMVILEGSESQLLRQIQKLEQGMGRGVRSSEDYCVVLLLGARLTQRLHLPSAQKKFTAATAAQLSLGRAVTDQVRGQSISELRPIIELCLTQDSEWVTTSRSAIASAPDASASFVDPALIKLRSAFDHARVGRYDLACVAAQEAVNIVTDSDVKGYYKQQLAEYTHHLNPTEAQALQLAAGTLNRRLVRPIAGITYTKVSAPQVSQANAAKNFMSRFLEPNDLVIWLNGLLEDLTLNPEATHRFEAAVRDLGSFLGFGSQRPEQDFGKGPDNLWAVGGHDYLVIECKSGAITDKISKSDCNQLIGSMSWFRSAYDASCQATPVMIHKSHIFDRYSSPQPETRIVDTKRLIDFRQHVRGMGVALATNRSYADAAIVGKQLSHFGLTGKQLIGTMSVGFKLSQS